MSQTQVPHVARNDIVNGLRSVGLEAGQNVVVHSSLKSFGRVEGGAAAVIDALEEVITPSGTLVMPTFSLEVLYFLEAIALERGINGDGATGCGVVFDGTLREFRAEIKRVWDADGFGYKFPSPEDHWSRLGKQMARWGWTADKFGQECSEDARLRLARNAPPLVVADVVPWRMPVWTGIIPETFWRRPETVSSHQYSGSFTVWGARGQSIIAGHDNRPTSDDTQHPLYRMKEAGGKILLLGATHNSNSTVHVAQWFALLGTGVRYPDTHNEFLESFMEVDEPLNRRGAQANGAIGNCHLRLADTNALLEVVAELLAEKCLARRGLGAKGE